MLICLVFLLPFYIIIFSIVIVPELNFFICYPFFYKQKSKIQMESLYKEDDDNFKQNTNATYVKEQFNELNLKRVASKEV